MQNMKIDFITNTIIVTRAFYEEAQIIGTEEYTALKIVMIDNPNMRVSVRTRRSSGKKNESKGLTYDFMRRFIRIMDRENLLTFEDTIKLYDDLGYSSSKKYQCVKEWFLNSYPLYKDMIVGSEPKIKKFKQNKTNEVAPAA